MFRPAKTLVTVLGLLCAFSGVGLAAQPEAEPRSGAGYEAELESEARDRHGDVPVARAGQGNKPSGMWGGTRPQRGGEYRYPYLIIGAIAALVAAIVLVFYIRRLERQRRGG